MRILQIRVEGLKDKPFWGLYTENYSKEISENPKTEIFARELSEIRKRYSTIFRMEFFINKGVNEPIPREVDIDSRLVREVEEETEKKQRENAHKP